MQTQSMPAQKDNVEKRVYTTICILCNKISKYQKCSRPFEKFTEAIQLRDDQTPKDSAIRQGDDKILGVTCRQEVADGCRYIHSLAFCDEIIGVPLFQKCGTNSCKKLIDIRNVAATHGIDSYRVLERMHTLDERIPVLSPANVRQWP